MNLGFCPYGLPGVTPAPTMSVPAAVQSDKERWEVQRKLEDKFLKALANMK